MTSVLRGTDEAIEVEDIFNSKNINRLYKYFGRFNTNFKHILDQKEFCEYNADPHTSVNSK
jgi:hypothetical protein